MAGLGRMGVRFVLRKPRRFWRTFMLSERDAEILEAELRQLIVKYPGSSERSQRLSGLLGRLRRELQRAYDLRRGTAPRETAP